MHFGGFYYLYCSLLPQKTWSLKCPNLPFFLLPFPNRKCLVSKNWSGGDQTFDITVMQPASSRCRALLWRHISGEIMDPLSSCSVYLFNIRLLLFAENSCLKETAPEGERQQRVPQNNMFMFRWQSPLALVEIVTEERECWRVESWIGWVGQGSGLATRCPRSSALIIIILLWPHTIGYVALGTVFENTQGAKTWVWLTYNPF